MKLKNIEVENKDWKLKSFKVKKKTEIKQAKNNDTINCISEQQANRIENRE